MTKNESQKSEFYLFTLCGDSQEITLRKMKQVALSPSKKLDFPIIFKNFWVL